MATAPSEANDLTVAVNPNPALSLVTFFCLTYAVTWTCWIPVVATSTVITPIVYLLWLLGTFAPSLVGIALTARDEGRKGVKALLQRILQWRVSLVYFRNQLHRYHQAHCCGFTSPRKRCMAAVWPRRNRPYAIGDAHINARAIRRGNRVARLRAASCGSMHWIPAGSRSAGYSVGVLASTPVLSFSGRYLQAIVPGLVVAGHRLVCCDGVAVYPDPGQLVAYDANACSS